MPKSLVGKKGSLGTIPSKLGSVFRDRAELAASADIGEHLRTALARSDFLIVLCSPASSVSPWVNTEIEAFREAGPERRERVLAVILSGDPEGDGFPPALRKGAAPTGGAGGRVPLAADFRPGRDRRRDAELRLIATLLGTGFDDLRRREAERRMRRLRGIVALAVVLVVGFAGLSAYAMEQRGQARREAARALTARTEAEKLVDFMQLDLRERLTAIGKLDLLQPTNEKVRAYYETIATTENDPDALRRRAAAFYQQGMDLRNLKNVGAAMQALLTAATLGERLAVLAPQDTAALIVLADTRRLLANQRQEAGDTAGALREIAQADRRLVEAARIRPTDPEIAMRRASLRSEEAESLIRSGKTVRAAERLDGALRKLEELLASYPKMVGLPDRTIAVAWKLGVARRRMGDFARAEPAFRRSLALAKELRDAAPGDIVRMRRYALSLGSLGSMLNDAGLTEDALVVLWEELGCQREIVARDPANMIYVDAVASSLSNLCAALITAEKTAEAQPLAEEMVGLYERMLARRATDARTRSGLAIALSTLGSIRSELGRHEAALVAGRRAVELLQEGSERDPADVKVRDDYGYARYRLGDLHRAAGRPEAAAEEMRAALVIMDDVIGRDVGNPQLVRKGERAQWQTDLGLVQMEEGAIPEARQTLTGAMRAFEDLERAGLPSAAMAKSREKARAALAKLQLP